MSVNESLLPQEVRVLIRKNQWQTPTTGIAPGYVQGNLVMLPKREAFSFLLFCIRNPKPCPVLDVLEAGVWEPKIAPGADLRTDLPRYRIYENGEFREEVPEVSDFVQDDLVSFLFGCSFSFESALLSAGVPVRNLEEGCNVSMYITNRPCISAGPFSSPLVVSMRPMKREQAIRAVQVTTRFNQTHGAPVHMGDPKEIGIDDIHKPDFGDPVSIRSDEIPVFWACGVTTTLAAVSAKLPRVITHAPGHMFISDLRDESLTLL